MLHYLGMIDKYRMRDVFIAPCLHIILSPYPGMALGKALDVGAKKKFPIMSYISDYMLL